MVLPCFFLEEFLLAGKFYAVASGRKNGIFKT
ncbi:MAG: viroplasmin family protein, partial [Ligilactobacillus ruminis]|nr:viroplasmin family protein [Ligilactobacillus ruminis]